MRLAMRIVFGVAIAVLLPTLAAAQNTAIIVGVVTDTSGAVLSGVTVEAASAALTEGVSTAVTDCQGRFTLEELPPGAYVVTFTRPGFSTVRHETVVPQGWTTINAEMTLQSGSVPPGCEAIVLARGYHRSSAVAVSNSGQAVGSFSFSTSLEEHAFSWTPTGGLVQILVPTTRPPGTFYESSSSVAVNDSGQVVVNDYTRIAVGPGLSVSIVHAFSWTATGGIVSLETLGGTSSEGRAINASGQITGWSDTAAGPRHAFIWTAAGGMQDLGTLGGEGSEARAVSDSGRVVGWSEIGGVHHAFSWTAAEGMVDLGTLGGANSDALAVNASGRVVGWSEVSGAVRHAFTWTPTGGMVELGTLGGMRSEAVAVSATGQVVGWSEIAIGDAAVHAFSWTEAGGMVDLGTLGGRDSVARAVNADGRVVGESRLPNGLRRGFSWTAAEGLVDLGTLHLGPVTATLVGLQSYATALNERSDIVGASTREFPFIPPVPFHATMWRWLQRDSTAPTLLLPATIVVDGTSPAGAMVTYTVSATDDQDANPVVDCSPPSGSVFPLRASIVTCTATDAAGNSATDAFQVVVLDGRQQIQGTIDLIASYHLTRLGTSLPDKLQLASGFVAAGDVGEACAVLTGFLNQVRAQVGKALTVEQATELTMRAIRIRNVIGC